MARAKACPFPGAKELFELARVLLTLEADGRAVRDAEVGALVGFENARTSRWKHGQINVADAATENVESRLKKAAQQLEHERERLKARVTFDPLKDIFAFQDVTLAQDATCAKCERDLAAGTHAFLGLTDEPARQAHNPRPGTIR